LLVLTVRFRFNKPKFSIFECGFPFADLNGFTPCTDQGEIDRFINGIVPYLESNEHVYAYAYSNGLGLGDVWPLMNGNSLR